MSAARNVEKPTRAQLRREQERAANRAAAQRLAALAPEPTEEQLQLLRGLLRTGARR